MEGQLNEKERNIITRWVRELEPETAVEIGTWLGGGSTLHILRALESNGRGHLWGVEASKDIYDRMVANIRSAGEELMARFTPLFGFSQQVIPRFIREQEGIEIGLVFLDGGDNPMEQVDEFKLLHASVPVGGVLLSHDAKLRKGKWLVPYVKAHDNWECVLHDVSDEGLFEARKIRAAPSPMSKRNSEAVLRSLRKEPAELVARYIPASLIRVFLRLLPKKVVLSLTQGR